MDIRRGFRQVSIALATSALLLTGISATTAQAAGDRDKSHEKGSIEVCKKVTGSAYDDYKKTDFKFVIRDKEDKEKYGFQLRHKDCKTVKHLDDGKYRIVEKDIPKKCKVYIDVKQGKVDSYPKEGVVVVELKNKKNNVEVTYTNYCKKRW